VTSTRNENRVLRRRDDESQFNRPFRNQPAKGNTLHGGIVGSARFQRRLGLISFDATNGENQLNNPYSLATLRTIAADA